MDIMLCFLDMDGVLVNFMKGVHKFHGLPYSIDNYPYEFGKWETCPPASFKGTRQEFWDPLGEGFYTNLDWWKDGKALLELIEKTFGQENICLLTSPTLTPGCSSGKVKWIQKFLPRYAKQFFIGRPKEFCAHDRAVLVDDRDKNIELFMKYGGQGILVPRPWNRLYHYRDEVLRVVRTQLLLLKETNVWKD